jgi:FKBP-type peptidyl-prolyl cis-trans isomerase
MRVGEKARIFLPWKYAFGEDGNKVVGPKTDIEIEVEILDSVIPKVIFHDDGEGDLLVEGNVVKVKYEGHILNGKRFDENFTKEGDGY